MFLNFLLSFYGFRIDCLVKHANDEFQIQRFNNFQSPQHDRNKWKEYALLQNKILSGNQLQKKLNV